MDQNHAFKDTTLTQQAKESKSEKLTVNQEQGETPSPYQRENKKKSVEL
jgi:hypothetical protein